MTLSVRLLNYVVDVIQAPHCKVDATVKSKQDGVAYAQQVDSQCLRSLKTLLITNVSFMPGYGEGE